MSGAAARLEGTMVRVENQKCKTRVEIPIPARRQKTEPQRIERVAQAKRSTRLVSSSVFCSLSFCLQLPQPIFGRQVVADVFPQGQLDELIFYVRRRGTVERLFDLAHDQPGQHAAGAAGLFAEGIGADRPADQ